jgi:hypothetical protein
MAIVRHYGKPMLFIIITANPNWREVREALKRDGHGLRAFDQLDIVNQVFQPKVDSLINYFSHHDIFGTHMAHCH